MRGRRAGGGCGRARLKTLCLGASRLLPFLPFSSPFSRSLSRCKKAPEKAERGPAPRAPFAAAEPAPASFVRLGSLSAAAGGAPLLSPHTRRSSLSSKRSRSLPPFSFCVS